MAVPKSRVSHARTHKRKSQWLAAATASQMTTCPHCGEVIRTYHVCPECGFYKGKQIVRREEAAAEQ